MPGGAMISTPTVGAATSSSMSRSSSSPSRNILRNRCRVSRPSSVRAPGSSASSSRSSAASFARSATRATASSRIILTAMSTRSRTIESTSRPTYPTSVNFVASTLMNGACASFASRRAISVLPTPVGPIIRMFFGVISLRSGSLICARRQRLRSAIATARFASCWPMMCLSSSSTISRGVIDMVLELLDRDRGVGVDADRSCDRERLLDDRARVELRVLVERLRCGLRVRAAGADAEKIVLGLDDVAGARDQQRVFLVGDDKERLEPAQHAVRAPILRELDRRAHEITVLRELGLEELEQRERVGGAAREPGDDLAVVEATHLACVALHDLVAERDLPVPAHRDAAVAAHADDRRTVRSEE